jgi:hypothetical protein
VSQRGQAVSIHPEDLDRSVALLVVAVDHEEELPAAVLDQRDAHGMELAAGCVADGLHQVGNARAVGRDGHRPYRALSPLAVDLLGLAPFLRRDEKPAPDRVKSSVPKAN